MPRTTRNPPDKAASPPVFDLKTPQSGFVPLVVDSPHSGTHFPADFRPVCLLADLRQSDEVHVDRFGESAVSHGGTFLKALVSRAYIDLNRGIGDLSPELCCETLPWPVAPSRRSRYGIGLIRHLVRPGEPVYDRCLTADEIAARVAGYYRPYYDALGGAINDLRRRFGRVLHVNLHGMPGIGADSRPMPDIVLGDHDGHSSARVWREAVRQGLQARGLKVVVNNPYKGAELTRAFARPRQGVHSLQIEINKSLYMNEDTFAVTDDMATLCRIFDELWRDLSGLLADRVAHAAE